MPQLTVFVSGQREDARLLTLPFEVFSPGGRLLGEGTASPDGSATLELPEWDRGGADWTAPERVHVLASLPNGTSIQQTAELFHGRGEVTLQAGQESPHEWLQWVTPFHSLSHLQSGSGTSAAASEGLHRRIGKVWMTLWALQDGRWVAKGVDAIEWQRDNGIQQFAINVPFSPHLLQIGGEEVAWRLVSLPPGGPVRVALTRSATDEGDAIDVTVGRRNPDNELIMSYLARGAVSEAGKLAEAWHAADLMLYEKRRDPVSAAAGAYILLKIKRLQDRKAWVDNLVEWFPYLADSAIVSAALALQRENANEAEIRAKIQLALDRGLPIFAMGASILVETMAAVHRGKRETKRFHAAYLAAQAYARARCSRGAYFAFYGKSPAQPSWTPIYGTEGDAIAGPASGGPAEAVFYARSRGAVQSGKFGSTTVSLPRAPVSTEMLGELRSQEPVSVAAEFERGGVGLGERLFVRTVELGIPALETSILQEFADSSDGAERVADHQTSQSLSRPMPVKKSAPAARVKRAPRQTARYWQDERQKHAMTVFDGNE
ncbi:MAG: hypothetical protein JJD98_04615 [Polaromonas sp.]|nr:hypothetical protein [Polaromonas sp.]